MKCWGARYTASEKQNTEMFQTGRFARAIFARSAKDVIELDKQRGRQGWITSEPGPVAHYLESLYIGLTDGDILGKRGAYYVAAPYELIRQPP